MNTLFPRFRTLAALAIGLAALSTAQAAVDTWSAASGTDLFWGTPGNWSAGNPPGTADTALFGNTAATNAPGAAAADVFLSANTTIQSLQMTNSAGYHNVLIAPGVMLSISNTAAGGALFAGGGVNVAVTNTISGPGGTLAITNNSGTINVRNGSGTGNSVIQCAMLDLSGLDTLRASVAQVLAGGDGGSGNTNSREVGVIYLAKTNIITTAGTAPAVNIGDNPSNGAGSGNNPTNLTSIIYLGQTNAIFADSITIGRSKCAGLLTFNPAFTGANAPIAFLGGHSGTRVSTFSVCDDSAQTTSNQGDAGTADFSAGVVNALVDLNYVGRGPNGGGNTAGTVNGTLNIGSGTYNVNTLEVAYQSASGSASPETGTVNLTGGNLIVNTVLELAHSSGTGGACLGTLNVSGGNVFANRITSGGGTSLLSLSGVALAVTNNVGTVTAPLGAFNLTNSTLLLQPTYSLTNIETATLNVGGPVTINIGSFPGITSYPVQFPLVHYTTLNGDPSVFTLGTLPAAETNYQGYISNDASGLFIDLVLTNGPIGTPPAPPNSLTWVGAPTGNWDTSTLNWTTAGVATNYNNFTSSGAGDLVTFDDTLTGAANVNLTTALEPGSVAFNNSVANYVLSGPGKIAGAAGLTKSGTGNVTLADTGGDAFTGGLTVNAGSLILDNVGAAISGNTTIAGGAVLQVGNNDAIGSLPTGSLTNNGTVILDRSDSAFTLSSVIFGTGGLTVNGTGAVNLTTVEAYTGPTVVNHGTLVAVTGNSSTLSASSSLTVNTNATVQLNADNALANNSGNLPIILNAGGVLTGVPGLSSHIHGRLTLNGGTLTVQGAQPQGNQQANGCWDLEGGVTVGNPPSPFTSVIACQYVVPHQTGGTVFNVTNGGTASGIDLNVTGTLVSGTSGTFADTGIILNGNGTLELSSANTFSGGVTLNSGTLLLANSNAVQNSMLTLNEDNGVIFAAGIGSFRAGNLTGYNSLNLTDAVGAPVTLSIGYNNQDEFYYGILGGTGSFIKAGTGGLAMSGTNLYAGSTTVSAGSLFLIEPANLTNSSVITISPGALIDVTLRNDQTLTLNGGETLNGSGTINGSLTSSAGSTLFIGGPGAVNPLMVAGTAALLGTTYVETTNAGTLFDTLQAGSIVYGGTLVVSNLDTANPFTLGQSFQLFSAGSYSGAFSAILPVTPGPGLAWNTNGLATSGTLSIIASSTPPQPALGAAQLSGSRLIFHGSNGTPNTSCEVLTSTNLTLPVVQWITNASLQFDNNGNVNFTNPVNPGTPQQFYRLKTP